MIPSSSGTRAFTLVMAYYKNAGMLAQQYAHWAAMPQDVKANLQVIVTDDGSPEGFEAAPPAEDLGLAFELYRLTGEKVPWNWIACRNLGVRHAAHDWVLVTDMDHLLPVETARRLMFAEDLDPRRIYRFSRVDAPDLTPYKPHPNSWFLTRKMYDHIGGYDERFSGCYGSDYDFRDRANAGAKEVVMLPETLVRYPREVVPDASTVDFERKHSEHAAKLPAARARIAAEGGPTLRGSFAWARVA